MKKILTKILNIGTAIQNRTTLIKNQIREFLFADLPRAVKNFNAHDGELSSCAMAFFFIISFIPVSLIIITTMSFIYKSEDLSANMYLLQLKNHLPSINFNEIISSIDKVVYKKRYQAFIWIPFLFWWGSLVFDIVERALEIAFRIERARKYWLAKIRHFVIIIGIGLSIVFLTLLSNFFITIKSSTIVELIQDMLKDFHLLRTQIMHLVEFPLLISSSATLFINAFLIFILYRFIPPKKLDNISMLKGALVAAFTYEIVKFLFSFYITEINDYTSIFGSLSSVVILMIWIWYTCFQFVIGAEISWVFYEKRRERLAEAAEEDLKKVTVETDEATADDSPKED